MAAALRIIITSEWPPRYDNSLRDFERPAATDWSIAPSAESDQSIGPEIDRAPDACVNAEWAHFASYITEETLPDRGTCDAKRISNIKKRDQKNPINVSAARWRYISGVVII